MSNNNDKEANARIIGILSIVFSIIPLLGVVLGVIATQKGRNGVSQFAVKAGFVGLAISVSIFIVGFFVLLNNQRENQKMQLEIDKKKEISECIERVKQENTFLMSQGLEPTRNAAFECN